MGFDPSFCGLKALFPYCVWVKGLALMSSCLAAAPPPMPPAPPWWWKRNPWGVRFFGGMGWEEERGEARFVRHACSRGHAEVGSMMACEESVQG